MSANLDRERVEPTNAAVPQAKPAKRVYRTPVLSLFGDVRTLTFGGGGMGNDGVGMKTKMCWIAEALYGVGTPRVILVRGWLTQSYHRRDAWARVTVPLYQRFGERVAAAIRLSPFLGYVFRPVFDQAVQKAFRASQGSMRTRSIAEGRAFLAGQ
ncbi:MAG: hypothetical protein IPP91_04895 [Betaproteobacteria bacterium]|nr:hypothetical protein [Betaproteobacteria bacterium]